MTKVFRIADTRLSCVLGGKFNITTVSFVSLKPISWRNSGLHESWPIVFALNRYGGVKYRVYRKYQIYGY
jgi:hypothetical protein